MIVVGAGLAGLIAASMLRDNLAGVFEMQSSLPNNHDALLRFRSSVVGDAVGIPFRKVSVIKSVQSLGNPVKDAISYSLKCTGEARLRSVLSAGGEAETRYIAPGDFIPRLAKQVGTGMIAYDKDIAYARRVASGRPIISTIPMKALMDELKYPLKQRPVFSYSSGATFTYELPYNYDVCATVYLPDNGILPYRASITERKLIIEFSKASGLSCEDLMDMGLEQTVLPALVALGISGWVSLDHMKRHGEFKPMRYAKILPCDEDKRKRFIMWASEQHNIYSLGRFATWRPGLLLDDIVNDVRTIQAIAGGNSGKLYEARK